MQAYVAEFIGTFILILLGNGVVANVVLKKTKGNSSGWIVITAGWGFAVTVAAYITGWMSGAHLNPAVTVGLAVSGLFPWDKVLMYIVSQMLGGMLGMIAVYLNYKPYYDETENPEDIRGTFCTAPGIRNNLYSFIAEFTGTFILLLGIRGITYGEVFKTTFQIAGNDVVGTVGIMASFLVGLLIWGIGLSLGGTTGYAINPARDLAPRIMYAILPVKHKTHPDWGYAWIPVVAPIIGGIVGSLVFDLIIKL
ncbi:MIP/aquaporin family protein [Clostridium frigidicarnis]|uniref:Glycerol uptake facilitator protein n=1 Tax=Clostridium frigidicarnis TaxID=84698 RepID=A0A1I0ZXW2_9CLOT|nr:MIP/aquaporin family protein [Clostridium frigidicarnis]SFB28943.1 glycerol uptake facilitator protein [Clostridium frigidicarnis]